MTPRPARRALVLMLMLAAGPGAAAVSALEPASPGPAAEATTRDVVFLAEDRPVFLRLRVSAGDRPFDTAWPDALRELHACLASVD